MNNNSLLRDALFYVFILIIVVVLIMFTKVNSSGNEDIIIGVHIKGEVNAPGYYELQYGKKLKDALLLAGGETERADLDKVNLAMKLVDGEEITISSKENQSKNTDGKININTADIYQLSKLDGIGESLAGKIIEYRMSKGKFTSINELEKVSGIGKSKMSKLKDKICVE